MSMLADFFRLITQATFEKPDWKGSNADWRVATVFVGSKVEEGWGENWKESIIFIIM